MDEASLAFYESLRDPLLDVGIDVIRSIYEENLEFDEEVDDYVFNYRNNFTMPKITKKPDLKSFTVTIYFEICFSIPHKIFLHRNQNFTQKSKEIVVCQPTTKYLQIYGHSKTLSDIGRTE